MWIISLVIMVCVYGFYPCRNPEFNIDPENYATWAKEGIKHPVSSNCTELHDSVVFPNRYIISAGADYSAWNGALLVGKYGSIFGVRVDYYFGNEFFSDRITLNPEFLSSLPDIKKFNTIFNNIDKADSYSVDGSYARLKTKELILEWMRSGNQSLYCKITARKDITTRIEMYSAYDFPSKYSVQNDEIHGKSVHVATIEGEKKITGGHAQYKGRKKVECDELSGFEYCRLTTAGIKQEIKISGNTAFYEIDLKEGEESFFTILIGEENIFKLKPPTIQKIENQIVKSEKISLNDKLTGTGDIGKCAEPCMDEFLWGATYFPYEKVLYFSPGRAWMADGKFNIWGWDECFNGIIASYLGDLDMVENQFNNTLVDERIGLISILNSFSKFTDTKTFGRYYEAYKKIYPIGDTALVRGGKNNHNVGKMDDTPMRELWRGIGEMYSLDATCQKCWSMEVLSKMAKIIGNHDESVAYAKDCESLKSIINETFWNREQGIYLNRYISGEWPLSKSPTSFYPLLCGAPTLEMMKPLMENLTDESKFWGKYIIPSLSKDDYEYGKPSRVPHENYTFSPYCYWRGAIWPMSNYIVYEGLKRCHLDEVAAEFAQKSTEMWWQTYSTKGWACENYHPETGEKTECSSIHQSWSSLMPLMGIQELIDSEPWEEEGSIKFGTFIMGSNSLENLWIDGHSYSVRVEDSFTELKRDGKLIFRGTGGKFNVRNFNSQPEDETSFTINAKADIKVQIVINKKELNFTTPVGINNIKIINDRISIEKV